VPAGQQIYVRDRQTGLTSLVSVDNDPVTPNPGNSVSSAPSISGDGRYVGFVSQATNLLAPDPVVLAGQQIYIRDRQLGQSSLASQDNTNTNVEGTGGVSNTPSTNSDGGFVVFFSQATNLVTGLGAHIYVRAVP
jgi:Tol biopolymer transport system component